MTNPYYNGGSFPATGSPATSASMRAELSSISAGFDKLPTLSGNASKLVVVNGSASALEATSTLPPLTITDSNFVVEDNADNTRKFRFEASSVTAGATRVLTVPDANLTLVGEATAQTLTNKTLNLASNTLVATSAQIAAAVTDETGSGALVFGTNPTISGATLDGSVTLSGGTANGVLYLDGSKVATSGSALTFDGTNLGVGDTTPSNYGAKLVVKTATNANFAVRSIVDTGGSSTGPAIDALNDNAGGVVPLGFRATQYEWRFASTEGMRLTSTGLGIGTSSPGQKLEVANTSGSVAATLRSSNSGYSELYFADVADNAAGAISYEHNTDTLRLYNGGAARVYLDTSGNLGLGVTPSAWSGVLSKALEFNNGCYVTAYNTSGTDAIYVGANNYYNGSNYIYKNSRAASQYQQVSGAHYWNTAPSGTAGNAISFTQALTLHASGGMSLGNTTDPGATNLSVTGTITSGKGANVASASTVTLGAGNFFDITGTTTISAITIKPAGTVVYLKFDSTINLQTGTIGNSGAMRLAGAGTLVATQYDVLTLISDGTNWWQTAFSAN